MTHEVNEPSAKYLARASHKRTAIGLIPHDWAVLALADIAAIERGKFSARPRNDPRYYGGEFPFIQTGDVTRSSGSITTFTQTLNREGLRVSRLFPEGTLFFTIAANIGDVGIAKFEAACPDSLVAIVPHAGIQKGWLLYELARRKSDFESLASPGAQLNINLEKLRPYLLPVPTEAEQRAIAAALSDADALIAGLEKLIAKKRDLKQAAMQQLLTGQTRLPGFSGEWLFKALGDIANIKTGSRNNEDKVEDGHYPFFVRSAHVERINSYSHECESILIPGEGQIGEIFHYINGRFDVHQRVYAITQFIEGASGKYIHLYMSQHFGKWAMQNTVKATVDSLRLPTFQNFQVQSPPTIEEQTAIAQILSDLDAELLAIGLRLSKTRELKQGMMQELLTGRTRLL
jgi:type I restriction enzyme S subunit